MSQKSRNTTFGFLYKPELAKTINVVSKKALEVKPKPKPEPKIIKINDVWDRYKKANKLIRGKTTQLSTWKQTDNCLAKVSEKSLQINNTDLLVSELLAIYSVGTLGRVFANLKAACNHAIKNKIIRDNPYVGLKLPKLPKNKIECYESDEIKIILEAFRSDEYMCKYTRVPHSYYYPYVKFVALTFCRPEDAIALTWNDIRTKSNGTFITFSKAYSRGILKDSKTHEIRVFKCNDELIDFIKTIPVRENKHNLLFPTPRSKSYMEFLTNTIALSFVEKLLEEVNRYEGLSEDDYDLQTTTKYILGMVVDIQIYLTVNEMITYGTRNPRLVYNETVYNHVDGQLSETYTTYELSIVLGLFKTEFLGALDNYYSLKDE